MEQGNTALIVMDVQPGIVNRIADKDTYMTSMQKAIDAAHANNIPVLYVVVGFRNGLPEISDRNKSFMTLKESGNLQTMTSPEPIIHPIAGDVVITKRRYSAFTGSDLEVILRSKDISHLILCGVSTSGVVLSTTREAADKDYRLTILKDLCSDPDEEVHRVLIEKIFPRQAEVIPSDAWITSLI